jgi:hypothetical protein
MVNKKKNSGVALFFVVLTVVVVLVLSVVILSTMSNQSRLTHHQISRIQAYYASLASINYSLEMLRIGLPNGWSTASCPSPAGCTMPADLSFPNTVISRKVFFIPAGTAGCNPPGNTGICIQADTDYTYTP